MKSCLVLLYGLLPELARGYANLLFEDTRIVALIVKTYGTGNFCDGHSGVAQERFAPINANAIHILREGTAKLILDNPAEVGFG